MRVKQVADQLKISTSTVRKYAREGLIEYSLNPAGQRVFTQEAIDNFLGEDKTVIRVFYIRSSSGDKKLLENQIQQLTQAYGEPTKVYSDHGSGLNENRPGLQALLRDAGKKRYNQLCITYEDRLARFGVSYLIQLLAKDGIETVILHDKIKYSLEDELLQDFMNLIASFSGKFYRLRSKQAQKQLLTKAQEKLE